MGVAVKITQWWPIVWNWPSCWVLITSRVEIHSETLKCVSCINFFTITDIKTLQKSFKYLELDLFNGFSLDQKSHSNGPVFKFPRCLDKRGCTVHALDYTRCSDLQIRYSYYILPLQYKVIMGTLYQECQSEITCIECKNKQKHIARGFDCDYFIFLDTLCMLYSHYGQGCYNYKHKHLLVLL